MYGRNSAQRQPEPQARSTDRLRHRSCGAAGTGRHVPQAAPPPVLPRRKRPPRRPVTTARSAPSLPARPGLGSRRITRTCRTGAASAAPRFRQPRDWRGKRHGQEVPPPRPRTRREARRDLPEAAAGPVLPPRGHSRDCARPQAAWVGRLGPSGVWVTPSPAGPSPAARVRARSPRGGTPAAPLCSLLRLLTVSRVLAEQPVRKPTKCPAAVPASGGPWGECPRAGRGLSRGRTQGLSLERWVGLRWRCVGGGPLS